MKKIISVLLCFSILLSIFSVSVFAKYDPTETKNEPISSSRKKLLNFAVILSAERGTSRDKTLTENDFMSVVSPINSSLELVSCGKSISKTIINETFDLINNCN